MIDRYDAPEGMVAVRVTRGCMECFFIIQKIHQIV